MNKTSNCCGAKVTSVRGEEGTNYWECTYCGEPCDVKTPCKRCDKLNHKIKCLVEELGKHMDKVHKDGSIIRAEVKSAHRSSKRTPTNNIGNDGCPCGEYDDGETKIYAHCWKSNGYYNPKTKKYCKCEYAGVHYKGKLKTAKRIAKEIEEGYHCEVEIVKL